MSPPAAPSTRHSTQTGAARPPYDAVLSALAAASPAAAAETIAAGVKRDGVVHGADGSAHPLAVDAVPRDGVRRRVAAACRGRAAGCAGAAADRGRLRSALLEMAGDGVAVILGREPDNIVWWELEQLSLITGWPLVGIDDLQQRGGRVVLRDDGSPVNAVWRRTNEDRLCGDDGRLTALGSLLIEPLRSGAVRVINAFGTGVADDKRTYVYVEALVRFYCGEEPLLRSVPAWDLAIDEQRAEALSTHPTVIDGRLEPRHVDLRPFVVGGRVLPGGLSRFCAGRGGACRQLRAGGGGKDVWVLAQ